MKPAFFYLVLTLSIGAYLGAVYHAILNSGALVTFVTSLTLVGNGTNATSSTSGSPIANGKFKMANGNGHAMVNNNGSPNGHLKVRPMKVN